MTTKRLLPHIALLTIAFLSVAPRASAAVDTLYLQNPDGTITILNALKVTGFQRTEKQAAWLTLDHKSEAKSFPAATVVRIDFGPNASGRTFYIRAADGDQAPSNPAQLLQLQGSTLILRDAPDQTPRPLDLTRITSLDAFDKAPPTVEQSVEAVREALASTVGEGPPAVALIEIPADQVQSPVNESHPAGAESRKRVILISACLGAIIILLMARLLAFGRRRT